MEDRAALLVRETSGCTIERNTFQETFLRHLPPEGERLFRPQEHPRRRNAPADARRNGIHVLAEQPRSPGGQPRSRASRRSSTSSSSTHGEVRRNTSEANQRYGLHFMFSDDCAYEGNFFLRMNLAWP